MDIAVVATEEFLRCMRTLPAQAFKQTFEFLTDYHRNPKSSGYNYETTLGSRDNRYRSVRIGLKYGVIVMNLEDSHLLLALWVAKHDDAYNWARTHSVEAMPDKGIVQILASSCVEVPVEAAALPDGGNGDEGTTAALSPSGRPVPRRSLDSCDDVLLRLIGVP